MADIPLLIDFMRRFLGWRSASGLAHRDPGCQFGQALESLDVILARSAGIRVDMVGWLVAIERLAAIMIRTDEFRGTDCETCADLVQSIFDAIHICHFNFFLFLAWAAAPGPSPIRDSLS